MSTVIVLAAAASTPTGGGRTAGRPQGDQPATARRRADRGRSLRRSDRGPRRHFPSGAATTVGDRLRALLYLVTISVAVGIAVAAALGLLGLAGWLVLERSLK